MSIKATGNEILLAIKSKFDSTGTKAGAAEMAKLGAETKKVGDASRKTAADLGMTDQELNQIKSSAAQAAQSMRGVGQQDFGKLLASGRQVTGVMQGLRSAILGGVIGALTSLAGVNFGSAFQKGIEGAQDFEKAMVQVKLFTGATTAEIEKFRAGVGQMSKDTLTSTGDLAKGFFAVQSAGIQGAEALNLTKTAAEGAAIGLGTTTDLVRAASTVYATFGKDGVTSSDALQAIAASAKVGNFEISELAGSLNKVIPAGKAAGSNFNDIAGNIANLSIYTGSATESVDQLNSLFVHLNQYSPQSEKLLKAAGTSMLEIKQNIKDKGLLPALDELATKLKETYKVHSDTAVAAIFQDQLATAAFRELTDNYGANSKRLQDFAVANKVSIHDMNEEFKKTEAGRLIAAQAALSSSLNELGAKVLPTLVTALQFLNTHFDDLEKVLLGVGVALGVGGLGAAIGVVTASLPALAAAFGVITAAISEGLVPAMLAFDAAAAANPIGGLIAIIAVLAGIIAVLYAKFEWFRQIVAFVWADVKLLIDQFRLLIDILHDLFTFNWSFSNAREGLHRLTNDVSDGTDAWTKFWDAVRGKNSAAPTSDAMKAANAYNASLTTSPADLTNQLNTAFGRQPATASKPQTSGDQSGGLDPSAVLHSSKGHQEQITFASEMLKLQKETTAATYDDNDAKANQAKYLQVIETLTHAKVKLNDTQEAQLHTQVDLLLQVGKASAFMAREKDVLEALVSDTKAANDGLSLNAYQRERIVAVMKVQSDATKAGVKDVAAVVAAYEKEYDAKRAALALVAGHDELDQLKFENSLLGLNSEQRAHAIELRALEQKGIVEGTQAWTDYGKAILALKDVEAAKLFDVEQAKKFADAVGDANQRLQEAADKIAGAFGKAGDAISGLISEMGAFRAEQASMDAEKKDALSKLVEGTQEYQDVESKYLRKSDSANANHYGNMISSAKGFFKEGSTGYKALQAAETVWRAFQLAMSVRAMFMTGAETTAHVAGEATKATATVASAGVQVAANTAVGTTAAVAAVANQGMGDPYTAFARIAAMTAIMVGLGFAIAGATGGQGNGDGGYNSETTQKTQGTGSVLGDATTKSDSIAKSMALIEAHTNKDLEYSSNMLTSLRSIDDQIGAVTTALAKQLGVGGQLSLDGLGLGTSGTSPSISNLGFSKSTTKTLADQGLEFNTQSLSDILSKGLEGVVYQAVTSVKKSTAFGLTYSTKTSTDVTSSALDADLSKQITLLIGSLKEGVLSAASVLGITGADKVLADFQVELGRISLKDMTSQEINDTLNAVFSKLGDEMAGAAVQGLAELQKAGEGLFETLSRVAKDYQVVDVTLKSVGMSFNEVGFSSVAARERLIDLAGGLDAFTQQVSDFSDAFLNQDQQIAPVIKAVSDEMSRLGLSGIKTKAQFAALVQSIDVSTEAGASLYTQLLAVAPAFAKVANYVSDLTGAANDNGTLADQLSKAKSALSDAYDAEKSALDDLISTFKDLAASLKKYNTSLYSGPAAMLSPEETYKAAKAAFDSTSAAAKGGDVQALKDLQGTSEAYLTASKNYYASSQGYFDDLSAVRAAVQAAQQYAQVQLTDGQQQLTLLQQQVTGLLEVNKSVLSVKDAITNLGTILGKVSDATSTQKLGANPGANALLAAQTGYTGDFGSGGFQAWIEQQPETTKALARTILQEQGQGYRVSFATGGEFKVGGTGGTDSQKVGFNASPSETVTIRTAAQMAAADDQTKVLNSVLKELKMANVQRGAAAAQMSEDMQDLRNEFDTLSRRIARGGQ